MSLALRRERRSPLMATATRLELEWADYPDDWPSFERRVRARGDKLELEVLDTWPAEFRAAAIGRAKRIENWQTNKLAEWLEKMDSLTEAEKAMSVKHEDGSSSIDYVPDNGVRLQALKFLIENVVGAAAQKGSGERTPPQTGIPIDATVIKALQENGLRLSEARTERAIEFRSGVDGRHVESFGRPDSE